MQSKQFSYINFFQFIWRDVASQSPFRFSLQIPFQFRPEQTEIIVRPKDMDPSMVAWKGAAIMSCLESAQELWIRPPEWRKIGVRLLRERAPFYW